MMEKDKFETWVNEAIESLPSAFREKLSNIEIAVEEKPPDTLFKQGVHLPPLVVLGLYRGVPLPKRRIYSPYAFPDKITIFRHSIDKLCSSEMEMKEMVIKTVLHEVGHYFGLSEEELKRDISTTARRKR